MKIGPYESRRVYCLDAREGMLILPEESVSLAVFDGTTSWLDGVKLSYRVLKEGGAIYALRQSTQWDLATGVEFVKSAGFEYVGVLKNNDLEGVFDYWVIGCKGRHALNRELPLEIHWKRTNETAHDGERNWRTFAHMIELSTAAGDIVLDPFAGSGACGIACVKTGREFIGFENDCEWVKLANMRIKEASE